MRAVDAFLHEILDYAGLFPPASLDLRAALSNFYEYQSHPRSMMLGRFVLPERYLAVPDLPARISLLADSLPVGPIPAQVEAIESKSRFEPPPGVRVFFELDWRGDFESPMRELAERSRVGVKLRTGGTPPDAVPPAERVASFLEAAARARLPVKFTAGLHVPVPNQDPVTGARMHGFLNVFAAAFVAFRDRAGAEVLTQILRNYGYSEFRFSETEFIAGPHVFPVDDIVRLRREAAAGFGSCSFLEPVEHLERNGYL